MQKYLIRWTSHSMLLVCMGVMGTCQSENFFAMNSTSSEERMEFSLEEIKQYECEFQY